MTMIESIARAMAAHAGWDRWDTATDCKHTPNGSEPDEEREYWRELAQIARAATTPSYGASVDTPELREILHDLCALWIGDNSEPKARLIAHIESLVTAAAAGERKDALEEAALLVETNELNSAAFNAAEIRSLIHSPATSSKEGG